ncbi:MAG: hypothetical protein JWO03_3459 [Bacteroidetes bacterium]|nr:hypothetical protein [Bacteroidota bacterium]
MNLTDEDILLCPSHTYIPGVKLIGIRNDDGTVSILPEALEVPSDFYQKCESNGFKPEERFRFTDVCKESGCKNWNKGRCGVSDTILEFKDSTGVDRNSTHCSIRSQCRWFSQNGFDACRMCKYIITYVSESDATALSP